MLEVSDPNVCFYRRPLALQVCQAIGHTRATLSMEFGMKQTIRDRGPPASIAKLVTDLHRHSTWQVFGDFVEMSAISISNAIDAQQREKREARYMEIVKRYERRELDLFPQMLARLVDELEAKPEDVLGRVFHELELHNKYTGQFFTPYPLCQMMAKMQTCDGHAQAIVEKRGFITAAEPACGSGAMVIALAEALREEGINYQRYLHVTATDVSAPCIHMAYLQLSLLHIPARIIHGNSLSLEEFARWYTPAHIIGGWDTKLRRKEAVAEHEPSPDQPEIFPARPQKEVASASHKVSQLSLF
jgi:hypothetical protein